MPTDLFPAAEIPIATIEEQLAEVRREIALREKWYPQWVASKRLTQRNADLALHRMKSVERTLKNLLENPK